MTSKVKSSNTACALLTGALSLGVLVTMTARGSYAMRKPKLFHMGKLPREVLRPHEERNRCLASPSSF